MTTELRDLVILIPHQMPPRIVDPEFCDPPATDSDDQFVEGDHDMNMTCTIGDWIDYPHIRGHHRHEVNALVRNHGERCGFETLTIGD